MISVQRSSLAFEDCTLIREADQHSEKGPLGSSNDTTFRAMDLPNILNSKGPAAAAAAAEQQLQQQLAQVANSNARNLSESGAEHGLVTRNTSIPSLLPMPSVGSDARFPSPNHLHDPLSMLPNSFIPQNMTPDIGFSHSQRHLSHVGDQNLTASRSNDKSEAMKAFACTTCQKGFARRSDLARHGMIMTVIWNSKRVLIQTIFRANPYWCSTPCLRASRLRQAIYSEISTDGPYSSTYWGETAHV